MLTWQDIDTVLLDMDGTLLDLAYDNHFWLEHIPEVYAKTHVLNLDQAKVRLHEAMSASQGTLAWYCIDHWTETLGFDVHEQVRKTAHKSSLRPWVFEFLNFLHAHNKHLLLVTNAHHVVLESKLAHIDIAAYFDHIVSSHDFQAPKESQRFWRSFAQAYAFDPKRTVLIDDNETVLSAAKQFGIEQVITLRQPDSGLTAKTSTLHPSIHHFNELFDTANAATQSMNGKTCKMLM